MWYEKQNQFTYFPSAAVFNTFAVFETSVTIFIGLIINHYIYKEYQLIHVQLIEKCEGFFRYPDGVSKILSLPH